MSKSDEIAIKVSGVSKSFKLPHEKNTSIKSLIVHPFRKRTYEKQEVLKNINFEIKKGEFFGIVGRNGSGKSTLLKLLAGIYSPDKGHIQINGKLTPFIELGVGFNPELTGRENVFLNGALLGFNRKDMTAMYQEIVDFAEIEKFMDQKLKNYSSGMQVRLAFSIAIRANSEILLLDEVLAVGDAAFQQKCYDYFEELKRNKKTVILVSHDMGAVTRFCNRAIYLKDGKIIQEGNTLEVAETYAVENIRVDNPELLDKDTDDDNTKTKSTEDIRKETEEKNRQKAYSITGSIVKQTKETIIINIKYKSKNDSKMYVGISITKDGVSIGEIATDYNKPLHGSGELYYELDQRMFNVGTYRFAGITLFRLENREVLAVNKKNNEFYIKGDDDRRGAAVRLPDSWKYAKKN